jgi:cell division protein FtsB
MLNQDELKQILTEEQGSEPSQTEETTDETSKIQAQIDALKKERERLLKEVTEIREQKRVVASENELLANKLRTEHLNSVLDNLQKKYNFNVEDRQKITEKINELYPDVVTKENLEKLAKATYFLINPDKIDELEKSAKTSEYAKNQVIEQQLSGVGEGSVPEEETELTPEELALAQKYGVRLETMKKLKKQGLLNFEKSSMELGFLTKGSKPYQQ